jgi:hypothetical protein
VQAVRSRSRRAHGEGTQEAHIRHAGSLVFANLDWLGAGVVYGLYWLCLALRPTAICGDPHPSVVFTALSFVLPTALLIPPALFACFRKHVLARIIGCVACLVVMVPLEIILDNVQPTGGVAISLQDVLRRSATSMPSGGHTYWLGTYNVRGNIDWRWAQAHDGYVDVTYTQVGDVTNAFYLRVVTFPGKASASQLARFPHALRVRTATGQDVLLWYPGPTVAYQTTWPKRAAHSELRPIPSNVSYPACTGTSLDQ